MMMLIPTFEFGPTFTCGIITDPSSTFELMPKTADECISGGNLQFGN